jgi:hypothetical protein
MKNEFLTWLRASFEETPGRASGKAISAFILVLVWVAACIVAIICSFGHILPEWMGYTNASLVAAFYSIKLVGKMFGPSEDKQEPKKVE